MDIKDFYGIGIIDVFWRYEEFDESWKKAFVQIYIPNKEGFNYGNQYCLKYSFLDKENVVSEEMFESLKLDFSYVKLDEDLYEVTILSEKHKLNKTQLLGLIDIINKKALKLDL